MFSTPGRKRAAWFIIGVLASSLFLLAMVAIVQTRDLAGTMRHSQKGTRALVQEIQGCTKPGAPCYERSKRQYARAVGAIQADNRRTIALAASCASVRYGQTTDEIAQCIRARIAETKKKGRR